MKIGKKVLKGGIKKVGGGQIFPKNLNFQPACGAPIYRILNLLIIIFKTIIIKLSHMYYILVATIPGRSADRSEMESNFRKGPDGRF